MAGGSVRGRRGRHVWRGGGCVTGVCAAGEGALKLILFSSVSKFLPSSCTKMSMLSISCITEKLDNMAYKLTDAGNIIVTEFTDVIAEDGASCSAVNKFRSRVTFVVNLSMRQKSKVQRWLKYIQLANSVAKNLGKNSDLNRYDHHLFVQTQAKSVDDCQKMTFKSSARWWAKERLL